MVRHLPFFFNAPDVTFKRAKRLRKKLTKAEKIMWRELRRNNLKGHYFRRQHPLAWYIADFYCHDAKLVVELDGNVHDSEKQKDHDARRDEVMKDLDLIVLRFKNEEVFDDLDKVLEEIKKHLP